MNLVKPMTISVILLLMLSACSSILNRSGPAPKTDQSSRRQISSKFENTTSGANTGLNSKTDSKSILINLMSLAKSGKVDNSPFTAGKSTITEVQQNWGKPNNQVVTGKGTYATYNSKQAAFGFNQNELIFDMRSYSKQVQSLTLSDVKGVLGDPKSTTKPTTKQVNEIYQVNNTFQLEFIINTDSSKVDHISVFDPNAVSSQPSGTLLQIPIRGVIEGFYGTPWSNTQRLNMFNFMEKEKLNTYVYAPKDDPYQRLNWRSLYPSAKLSQMQTLVIGAKKEHVNFIYSISPGMTRTSTNAVNKSITYCSQSDRKALEAKLDQLRSIGVHTFMLSFDDILTSLKSDDRKAYGSDYPKAQMQVANQILTVEKAKDSSFQLWFAPTSYYGLTDDPYWRTLRSILNRNIKVIWTGNWVLNQSITSTQAQTITKLLGRKPILWDNYPVNDYTYVQKHKPQLLMGPLEGRSASLTNNIAGYMSNPMIQPSASKLALETISDYLQNPNGYHSRTSWENAVKYMPGITDPSLFKIFVEFNTSSILNTTGYSPIKSMVAAYQNASANSQKQAAEKALEKEFSILVKLPSALPPTISDKELLHEIQPWLTKLGDEGQGGLDAIVYLNKPNQTNKQRLADQIKRINGTTYKIGDDIVSFIQWAENQK
ncbi:MAG: beta-N-acetylglucosaminidase domain-containing protein [Bacillota bacterium]|nr:beta-N-acetylglucosaminidase domain-containing protein [Bacillota bacterium]